MLACSTFSYLQYNAAQHWQLLSVLQHSTCLGFNNAAELFCSKVWDEIKAQHARSVRIRLHRRQVAVQPVCELLVVAGVGGITLRHKHPSPCKNPAKQSFSKST